jgi:hypothetical protein
MAKQRCPPHSRQLGACRRTLRNLLFIEALSMQITREISKMVSEKSIEKNKKLPRMPTELAGVGWKYLIGIVYFASCKKKGTMLCNRSVIGYNVC